MIAKIHSSLAAAAALLLSLGLASTASAQPLMGKKAAGPNVIRHEAGKVSYRISIIPGAPKPGETFSVEISLLENLEKLDAKYGKRRPITDATMTMTLAGKGKKAAVMVRNPTSLGDPGAYGFSFTAPKAGPYGLHLGGQSESAGSITFATNIFVGVEAPKEAMAQIPLPKNLPQATDANLAGGRALCDEHCAKDLDWALPKGDTPQFLESSVAAAMGDAELMAKVAPKAKHLGILARKDLLAYLRSTHLKVQDFFPDAAAFMAKKFTINQHGLDRLKDSAKLKLADGEKSGVVFIVYKGEKEDSPRYFEFDDRGSRDKLKKKDKIGYLVFFELKNDPKTRELGIGMKPDYKISELVARTPKGDKDAHVNRDLRAMVGQGEFNQPKSIRKGSKTMRKKVTPLYLRAAELATMYFADEREFTAFDEEFGLD